MNLNFGQTPLNAPTVFLMNSSEKADLFIKEFKQSVKSGMKPESAVKATYRKLNVTDDDFSPLDINRINREINRYVENQRYRY